MIKKAEELIELIHEVQGKLEPDGKALIISHDITIVPAEQLLTGNTVGIPTKTFNPLGGFIINNDDELSLVNF